MELKLPQFMCIGAQKAGTSWLFAMLKSHPEVFVPDKKEVHFFDLNYLNGLEWYSNHYMFSGKRLRGDITPAYAILDKNVVEFIKSIIPELKIIFIIRNPIERAWSHLIMEFTQVQKRDLVTVTDEEILQHINGEGSIKRGDYASTLDTWLNFYSESQIKILNFSDIKNNPETFLKQTFEFLGVNKGNYNYSLDKIGKRVFEGPRIEMPEKYKGVLLEIYKSKIERLKTIYELGDFVDQWVK